MSEEVTVKFITPRQQGIVTRQFTVWCGICPEWEMQSANNIDQFMESISGKNGDWRLTREHGWTHKRCMRMLPTQIKFNTLTEEPTNEPTTKDNP